MQYNKIIIFLDFSLPKWLFINNIEIIKQKFSNQEIFVLDWNEYFEKFNNFEVDETIDFFESKINNFINKDDKVLFISFGLSATILNLIPIKNCLAYKNIYFSLILSENYINPFTTNKPTYKTDSDNYFKRLKKEIYNTDKLDIKINSKLFRNIYYWYLENKNIVENIVEKISLFDFLNYLHKKEFTTLSMNDIFVFGNKDNVIDFKKTLKIFVDKKINSVIVVQDVSHHCFLENIDSFIKIIKSCENY